MEVIFTEVNLIENENKFNSIVNVETAYQPQIHFTCTGFISVVTKWFELGLF